MTDPIKPESPTVPGGPPRRIVLTGFMGSGKSTVGPMLARRLGWSFIDVDEVIEADARVPIAELFARHGEAAFRDREQATIARLHAEGDGRVLALGGGAIERPATRELLLNTPGTMLVHLEVEFATTLARCAAPSTFGPSSPMRPTWLAVISGGCRFIEALMSPLLSMR